MDQLLAYLMGLSTGLVVAALAVGIAWRQDVARNYVRVWRISRAEFEAQLEALRAEMQPCA